MIHFNPIILLSVTYIEEETTMSTMMTSADDVTGVPVAGRGTLLLPAWYIIGMVATFLLAFTFEICDKLLSFSIYT